MISEDYISFEVAKLLKEKGFDESIETLIGPEEIIYHLDENSISRQIHSTISNSEINIYSENVSCPTTQMAMKWLREVHDIFIEISVDEMLKDEGYQWTLYYNNTKEIRPYSGWGDSYENAVEAAIKYCLINLI